MPPNFLVPDFICRFATARFAFVQVIHFMQRVAATHGLLIDLGLCIGQLKQQYCKHLQQAGIGIIGTNAVTTAAMQPSSTSMAIEDCNRLRSYVPHRAKASYLCGYLSVFYANRCQGHE